MWSGYLVNSSPVTPAARISLLFLSPALPASCHLRALSWVVSQVSSRALCHFLHICVSWHFCYDHNIYTSVISAQTVVFKHCNRLLYSLLPVPAFLLLHRTYHLPKYYTAYLFVYWSSSRTDQRFMRPEIIVSLVYWQCLIRTVCSVHSCLIQWMSSHGA